MKRGNLYESTLGDGVRNEA